MNGKEEIKKLWQNMENELTEVKNYENHFNRIEDPETKKAIAKLIFESMVHAAKFRKAAYDLQIEEGIKNGKCISCSKGKELDVLFKKMLETETELKNTYKKQASETSDEKIKQLLREISEQEAEHENTIKKLMEKK